LKDNKKIKYNLLVGVIGQFVALIFGVVVPKLVLTNYGSEVNGLLSSVTNIYAYIAIVEAGVAAASCQALYKFCAEKSKEGINRVLSATNRYYYRTGLIYMGLIVLFSAGYPLIIKSDIPYYTVFLVILFNGLGNVINFFFHGKYLILLKADGKNYVRTGVEIFTTTVKYISKVVLIALGCDVVFVQFAALLVSLLQMIFITRYIRKTYSWVDLKAEPDFEAISQNKSALAHQINYLVVANTDTVVLTLFSTLKTVSIYSLYILLYNMVEKVLQVVRDALEFKLAGCFHVNREKFVDFFRAYEVYYFAFSFSLFSIVDFFILPFLSVYTANVHDVNYVIGYLPLFFSLVKLLSASRYPYDAMMHIAGHFEQTRRAVMIESIINIVISVILARPFGIVGVLLGTVVASIYHTTYMIIYVHRSGIVEKKIRSACKSLAINFSLFFLIDTVGELIGARFSSYIDIFLACIPVSFAILTIYFGVNSLLEPRAFASARDAFKSVLRRGSEEA